MPANPVQSLYQRLRYSPFLCQLVVTRRCNIACRYCHEFDRTSEPVPFEELQRRIDRVARLGSWGLEFTGGEPLLHPRLTELVRHARPMGFTMLAMITNALLLDRATIEQLNAAGLTEMQVSVDGVRPNKTTVKVLDRLRDKLLLLARHAHFKVVLSAVVGANVPSAEVEQVIHFARDNGFRPRVLLIHDAEGQMALTAEQLRTYRRAQRMIGRHYKDIFNYRERLLRGDSAPFACRSGSRYLYIDEHGMVRWCSQQAEDFGKPLADYTHDDLRQQFFTFKDCNEHCTIGCARSCSSVDRLFPQPLIPP